MNQSRLHFAVAALGLAAIAAISRPVTANEFTVPKAGALGGAATALRLPPAAMELIGTAMRANPLLNNILNPSAPSAQINLERLQEAIAVNPRAAQWVLELNYSQSEPLPALQDFTTAAEPIIIRPRAREIGPGYLPPPRKPAPAAPRPVPAMEHASPQEERHAARFAGDTLDSDAIMRHVKILAGEEPVAGKLRLGNRYSQQNKTLARAYLDQQLQAMGYEPRHEDLRALLPGVAAYRHGRRVVNVIAEIKGSSQPDEIVEIVTHYDSANPIAPGADDNASGVAAVLEMARVLKTMSPARTIRFVFVDLEEAGSVGSRAHVEKALQKPEKIVAAVVLDMIGYHPEIPEKLSDMTIGERGRNKAVANVFFRQERLYGKRPISFFPLTFTAKPNISDHGSYWGRGLPAVYIGQNHEHFNPYKHTPKDTTARMNPQYLAQIARLVLEGTAVMAGARIAEALQDEFNQRLAAYQEAYRPQASKVDFVGNFQPILKMLERWWRMDNKIQRLKKFLCAALDIPLKRQVSHNKELKIWKRELSEIAKRYAAITDLPSDSPGYHERLADFLIDAHRFARKWDLSDSALSSLLLYSR